ncbi:MAG: TusE/DsrC/DsvC family sulfur relay protein, partial [Candidatus Hydrothermarchaeota archaeon]|nr:TusE/DsrC/DsvC family sulfur relay protein [Candidatus Hydrothermarchaeota archaeon]
MAEELEVGGKKLALDEDGFMKDWEAWNKEVAEAFAAKDGVTLT